jgi:hypothetical protein
MNPNWKRDTWLVDIEPPGIENLTQAEIDEIKAKREAAHAAQR